MQRRSQPMCATLAGSDPAGCVTISQPSRWLHMVSCSTAAARNVSPAANSTFLPPVCSSLASFEMDVVFPEPLTPATRITVGPLADCLMGESGSFVFQAVCCVPLRMPLSLSLTMPRRLR